MCRAARRECRSVFAVEEAFSRRKIAPALDSCATCALVTSLRRHTLLWCTLRATRLFLDSTFTALECCFPIAGEWAG